MARVAKNESHLAKLYGSDRDRNMKRNCFEGFPHMHNPPPIFGFPEAVIAGISNLGSIGPILGRRSQCAPVAVRCARSTGPSGHRIPSGRFHLRIADDSRVTRYQFGTKTAHFHICLTCGVLPIATCMIEGTRYAVVNVNTFDGVDRSQLVETATDFEGETMENRLARRRRNWTPEAVGLEGGRA